MGKRVILSVLLALTLLSHLTAVAFAETETTIVHLRYAGDTRYWRELYSQFEAENPGIKIKDMPVDPGMFARGEIVVYFAGDVQVDVLWVHPGEHFYNWVREGLLLDLTPYIENDPEFGQPDYFLPAEYSRDLIDGRWYAIGDCWTFPITYYNPNLYDQAGLRRPPRTASEGTFTFETFIDYARKLTRKDASGNVTRYGASIVPDFNFLFTLLLSTGNPILNDDKTEFTLDDPLVYKGLQLYVDAHREGILEGTHPPIVQAIKGKAVMGIDGAWNMSYARDAKADIGYAMFPHVGPKPVTYAHSHQYAISANSKYPEEAWKWLKFLTSAELAEKRHMEVSSGAQIPIHREFFNATTIAKYSKPDDPEGFLFNMFKYMIESGRPFVFPTGFNAAFDGRFMEAFWAEAMTGQKSVESLIAELLPVMNKELQRVAGE